MPEHELVDLDAAFHDLATQVSAHTRARGPRAAIKAARRRRGAGLGAATVALLVAGGVLFNTFASTTTALPPPVASAPPIPTPTAVPVHEVPAPAPLTAARLDEASVGWVSGWVEGSSPVLTDSPCISEQATLPNPVDDATVEYAAGADFGASYSRLRFSSAADAGVALRALVAGGAACERSTGTHDVDFSAELKVTSYSFRDNQRLGTVWLVAQGDQLDMLTVVGGRAADDDVLRRVAVALAADVQSR